MGFRRIVERAGHELLVVRIPSGRFTWIVAASWVHWRVPRKKPQQVAYRERDSTTVYRLGNDGVTFAIAARDRIPVDLLPDGGHQTSPKLIRQRSLAAILPSAGRARGETCHRHRRIPRPP